MTHTGIQKKERGFTLIEILLVISIAAILLAVILGSIEASRKKGKDLKVRQTLSDIVVKVENSQNAIAGVTDYQTAFTKEDVQNTLAALATELGVAPGSYVANTSTSEFVVVFPLSDGTYYCVDSLHNAKKVNGLPNLTGAKSCDNTIGGSEGSTGGTGNIPPTANAGQNQTISLPTSTATLSGSGTDSDGTIASYAWTKVSGGAATITSPSSASTTVTGLAAGVYVFKLIVTDNLGATGEASTTITVNSQAGGAAYGGSPRAVPGTIQAEDFDNGGEGVAYHDTDAANVAGQYRPTEGVDIETTQDTAGAYNVGWINAGEWMNYTVSVQTGGTYTIQSRIAGFGGSFSIKIDGTTAATVNVPSTNGYQLWQTVSTPNISLTAGTHTIRLTTISPGYNLNYITFVATVNQPPTANAGPDQTIALPTSTAILSGSGTDSDGTIASYAWTKISGTGGTIASPSSATTNVTGLTAGTYTFRLTVTDNGGATSYDDVVVTVNTQSALCFNCPHNIPGTIQAEDYDTGGEGTSFHDLTAWNSGGASYRNDAVDIESTSDSSGAYDVAYIGDGEWLRYSVTVTSSGNYTISARAASAAGDSYLRMKMDGQFVRAIVVPNTGGWQTWQTISVSGVPLTAGTHTMEIEMHVTTQWGGMNLNSYTFAYEGAATAPNPATRTLTLRGPMAAAYGSPMYFYESLPKGYYDNPSKTYPLLVFLHGSGEAVPNSPTSLLTGPGLVNQINAGAQLEYTVNGVAQTFVVLAPQSDWWWNVNNPDKIIEFGKINYKIDPTRIYLIGLSAGSGGIAKYFGYSPAYGDAFPRKIAAAALFDGMPNTPPTQETSKDGSTNVPLDYCYAGSTGLPLWLFESAGHYPQWMDSLIATLSGCSPAVNMKTTSVTDSNAYTKGFVTDHTYYNPNVYEWLLQFHR